MCFFTSAPVSRVKENSVKSAKMQPVRDDFSKHTSEFVDLEIDNKKDGRCTDEKSLVSGKIPANSVSVAVIRPNVLVLIFL